MRWIVSLLFSVLLCVQASYAQTSPYKYIGGPFSATNPTPIANTTPVPLITPVSTALKFKPLSLSISNMSASVATRVQLRSGTTVIDHCAAAANGGGCTRFYGEPLPTGLGESLSCVAETTGADVKCTVTGFTSDN